MADQTRENNPNWRGGRVIASNGYVLLRVGKDHHLADVRGYAYEHRVVAEQKIGRRLRRREVVHHVDGNKLNNVPANLEVLPSTAHHAHFEHGREENRAPGERNLRIECACGCGRRLTKYDDWGRPRRFIAGHNEQPSPVTDAVLAALKSGPLHRRQLACASRTRLRRLAVCLSRLKRQGVVEDIGRGEWRLTDG